MLILALESSAKAASTALLQDGRLIGEYFQDCGLTHSATLLKMTENLLRNTGRTLSEVGLVAVARGPGSFTGIRIGVSAAKGLCWALDTPCAGVSTLEAAAYCAAGHEEKTVVCAVMDARRGQFYNALFEIIDGKPKRLCGDRAIDCGELAANAASDKRRWVLTGDGAELCFEHFERRGVAASLAPTPMRLQRAYGVALAAAGEKPQDADGLKPIYLRLSQAERERLRREGNGV